jgi:hypothetical protein
MQDVLLRVETTPPSGEEILGVVGFPGDKWFVNKDGTSEAGTKMYESWKMTNWDVKSGMLGHSIPTTGGMDPQQALIIVKMVTLKRSIRLASSQIEEYESHRSPHEWRCRSELCLSHLSRDYQRNGWHC